MADKIKAGIANDGSVVSVRLTEVEDGVHAERVEAYPPVKLMTDGDGENARLRVDVGETSFFNGREFRTFKEFSIAASGKYLMRFVFGTDIYLRSAKFTLDGGTLRATTYASDATPSGTFSETLPVFAKNATSSIPQPPYVSQTVVTAVPSGGSLSGGVLRDVERIASGVGNSATVGSIGDGPDAERGLAAGTYYMLLENLTGQTITGTFKSHWEERP